MATPNPQIESSSDDRLWVLLGYIFTPIIPIIIMFLRRQEKPTLCKSPQYAGFNPRAGGHCSRNHHHRCDIRYWILHHHSFMDLSDLPGY